MGFWKIIVPEATTNLVNNPTAKVASGLTAIGAGTVSRVTTYSYLGPACHRIVASADDTGGYFTLTACANAIHYVTLRINTASDVDAFDISLDNSNWNDMALLGQEGSWYVYGVQIPAAQANASTALRIQQKGSGAIDLFIGHAQVEQKEYYTTPVTGDLDGFIGGYKWTGTANNSSSTRSAQERHGGRVRDLLDDYSVRVRWASGVGMAPITHHTQRRAMLPGMSFEGARTEPRVLDITAVMGTSYTPATIHSIRKDLVDIIKLDAVTGNQPMVLRYVGALSTNPVDFYAVYDTGMGFDMGNNDFDQPIIRLICYDPFAYQVGEASAQLTTTLSISDADYAVKRIDGVWSNINTALNGGVYAVAKLSDGTYVLGGEFTNVGDANGDYIVNYNPTTGAFTSYGSGFNGIVLDIAVAPNGYIWAVGAFTTTGATTVNRIAYWDGAAWNAITVSAVVGLTNTCNCIAIDQSGNLWLGGLFTNVGDANGDYAVFYNVTANAWTSLGGMDGQVLDVIISSTNTCYMTGAFTTGGGVTLNGIGYWGATSWTAMGTGLAGSLATGYALAEAPSGDIYIGGIFNTAGGVTSTSAIIWNGASYEPMGSGITGGTPSVYNISVDDDGVAYFCGNFTTAGGLTTVDMLASWNGYTWTHIPIDIPGADSIRRIYAIDNDLVLGYLTTGTAASSYVNTITNSGSARAYPVVTIGRSGGTSATATWLKNETTGATVYLNYALLDGETLTLDFRPGKRAVTSSYFGQAWRAVLRGSDFTGFYLQPGSNSISAYVAQVGSPTMTQYMTWTVTHDGADGAAA